MSGRPYYQDDAVTIYHGDALDVMPHIRNVRTTITSPPYNTLGSRVNDRGGLHAGNKWLAKLASHGYADDLTETEYGEWQAAVAASILLATVPGGSLFYNHKLRYRDLRPVHPFELVKRFDGWQLRQEIVWDRGGAMALNARMFAPSDERIYWMLKPGADYIWNQAALATSVWSIRPVVDPRGNHPCPFPEMLPARCIAATTAPGDVVLDPFMGTGTTLRAAKSHGRKAIGVEVEERYCEIAATRLCQEVMDFGEAA